MRQITLISTGGTIEKTYDEHAGTLSNRSSVVQEMLRLLRLEGIQINTLQLMQKDSLDITDQDRQRILDAVKLVIGPPPPENTESQPDQSTCSAVIILHGTDTLCQTGNFLHQALTPQSSPQSTPQSTPQSSPQSSPQSTPENPSESLPENGQLHVPVILTGAMRPFEMKRSDALQNLNESIFAATLLAPGVYVVAHAHALPFPGPKKDRERGTFVQTRD